MNAYTFRIWFTGLVHFVENKDPYAKCQLCVVVPIAEGHCAEIDKVYRETVFERLRLRAGDTILPLDRKRVVFRVTRVDDLQPQPRAAYNEPYGVLGLEEIAGIFVDEYDQIVSADPPQDLVQAQVLVGGDYVFGFDPELSIVREWEIPGTLTGRQETVWVADPMYVEIPAVVKVELLYYSLDTGDEPVSWGDLEPGGNGYIEILVSNRCPDCELDLCDIDLRWGADNSLTLYQIDNDFAFNYQMLDPKTLAAMAKVLPPDDGNDDRPRYPLPESYLFKLCLAPHLKPPCLSDPDCLPESRGDRNQETEASNSTRRAEKPQSSRILKLLQILMHQRRREHGLIEIMLKILNLITTGTGVGSGSDCLGSRGSVRFLSLDDFIPSALPLAPSAAPVHALSRARRAIAKGPVPDGGSAPGSTAAPAVPSDASRKSQ